MKKVIYTCDRCGAEITDTVFYVTISADSIVKLENKDYRQTLSAATQNLAESLKILNDSRKTYCEKCKKEIEQFCLKGCGTQE
jgi:ribosomal protein L37AE/L43A